MKDIAPPVDIILKKLKGSKSKKSYKKELYKEIIKKFKSKKKPLKPKSSVRNKFFSINVLSENFVLQEALIGLRASFVQKTYIL